MKYRKRSVDLVELYSCKIGRVRVGEKFHGLPWPPVGARPRYLDSSMALLGGGVESSWSDMGGLVDNGENFLYLCDFHSWLVNCRAVYRFLNGRFRTVLPKLDD